MSTTATPTTRTKVLLVDDHDLIRRGLRHAFERDRQFEVVGEAATAAEAIRQAGALQPDVVIMDLRLPDGSGLEATRALRKTSNTMGIVVLTMYAGDDQLFGALEAGASAFVPKTAPAAEGVAAARPPPAAPARAGVGGARPPPRGVRPERVHRRGPGRGDEAPAGPERPAAFPARG